MHVRFHELLFLDFLDSGRFHELFFLDFLGSGRFLLSLLTFVSKFAIGGLYCLLLLLLLFTLSARIKQAITQLLIHYKYFKYAI